MTYINSWSRKRDRENHSQRSEVNCVHLIVVLFYKFDRTLALSIVHAHPNAHDYHMIISLVYLYYPWQEELRILDFHYSNLEFACGATLDKVRLCVVCRPT